jgi:hypothetical protein
MQSQNITKIDEQLFKKISLEVQGTIINDRMINTVSGLEKKYPEKSFIILFDNSVFSTKHTTISIYGIKKEVLLSFDKEKVIFVYACDDNVKGSEIVEFLYENEYKVYPVHQVDNGRNYAFFSPLARECYLEEFVKQRAEKWDKFSLHDFLNIMQAIDFTENIGEGDFVEIGVFNGSSGSLALNYMRRRNIQTNCYFYDLFTGFDYQEAQESSDILWAGTHMSHGIETIARRLKQHEDLSAGLSVTVQRLNIITDDLPNEHIRLASIDVDMYEAILAALTKVAPRIVPGGMILLEDPVHLPLLIGAFVAYNKFMRSDMAKNFMHWITAGGQILLIRTY